MARKAPLTGRRPVGLLDLDIHGSALPRAPELAQDPGCEPPAIVQSMMTDVMGETLPLRQMCQYHLANGGKGLRSGLCLSLWQTLGADPKESLRQRPAWSLFTGAVPDIL